MLKYILEEGHFMENELLSLIYSRRSVRNFLLSPLKTSEIEEIVEAGRVAPTANNTQSNHFVAITNTEVLKKLHDEAKAAYERVDLTINPSLEKVVNRARSTPFNFFYNAPCFIVVTSTKENKHAVEDGSVALENMMMAAHSIKIGSVWINQLKDIQEDLEFRKFLESIEIHENEQIIGCLAIGYFDKKPEPVEHKGNKATYIK